MRAGIRRADPSSEFLTPERCAILEVANDRDDDGVSISRARVAPGVTTAWHRLRGVDERYLIVAGSGRVEVDGLASETVTAGDVVRIPAGVAQRISNTAADDLVFYCICSPPFAVTCYESLE